MIDYLKPLDVVSLSIPILIVVWCWLYARRTFIVPSDYIYLVYHPVTGTRVLRLIRTLRMVQTIIPAVVTLPFVFQHEFQWLYLTNNEGDFDLYEVLIKIMVISPVYALAGVALILFLSRYYVRKKFEQFARMNPEHAKFLTDLGKVFEEDGKIYFKWE